MKIAQKIRNYYKNLITSKHLKGRLVPRVCHVFGSTTILVLGCPLSVTFLDQQQSWSLGAPHKISELPGDPFMFFVNISANIGHI